MARRIILVAILFFGTFTPRPATAAEPAVPDCVHWRNSYVLDEFLDHASVQGKKGERVHLHRRNPQLCAGDEQARRERDGYLVPGDAVTIGHTCGAWTHVMYAGKKSRSYGWVETARLKIFPPDETALATRRETLAAPWWTEAATARAKAEKDPLSRAVSKGDIRGIRRLAAPGRNLGDELLLAVLVNRPEAVRTLLELGANPNGVTDNCGLLATAAYAAPEIIRSLIRFGADPNCVRGPGKTTPLMVAAAINRADALRRVRTGQAANPGPEPVAVSKILLGAGARIDARDDYGGQTALRWTLAANNVDVARLLLDAGADPDNHIDDATSTGVQKGNTILMEAVAWYALYRDTTMLEEILRHDPDVDYRNGKSYDPDHEERTFQGQTALTVAVSNGYFDVVRLLLEHGADPLLARSDGASPSDIAAASGYREIAELLRTSAER